MDTKEQYDAIRIELKNLSNELKNLNIHCNERLSRIENESSFYNLRNKISWYQLKQKKGV